MLLLARHGQTDDNCPPLRFQGSRDTPLNECGRKQARELAETLADEGLDRIVSSPLSRARETAEAVADATGLEVALDARFAEGDRGAWEGLLMEEVERLHPERYAAWRRAEPDFSFAGGESLLEHQARVAEALGELRPLPGKTLVVCHGGSIRVELCRRDPAGFARFFDWDLPNCAVVRL
ncbi:MAG: histidine phosphatase family protein [Actinomycetes bacterium]